MAVTFPMSIEDFMDKLGVVKTTFHLPSLVQSKRQTGGGTVRVEPGERMWVGKVELRPYRNISIDRYSAMLELLGEGNASFFVTPSDRKGPQSDPTGVALAASTPLIRQIGSGGSEISFKGLPGGFKLNVGDMVSFVSAGTHCLHRIQNDVTASGSGNTSLVTISPPPPPGLAIDIAVQFVQPRCMAEIVSYDPSTKGITHGSPISFGWEQTFT